MATDKAAEGAAEEEVEVGLKSSSGALMLIHPRKSLCISRRAQPPLIHGIRMEEMAT